MNEPKAMDAIGQRILRIVQKDALLSIREISTRAGLSQTTCGKRLQQRLDASGVIKRRIALLDPLKPGLGLAVAVSIEVGDHSGKALPRFAAGIAAMEEVMEFYRVADESIASSVRPSPARRPSTLFTNAWPKQCRSRRLRHASPWKTSNPKPVFQLLAGANRARSLICKTLGALPRAISTIATP